MGRGKQLSQSEIDHVLQLKEQNFKISQIARSIERSRTVVETLLKDPSNYGFGKKMKKKNAKNTEKDKGSSSPSANKVKVSPQKAKSVSPTKKQDGKTTKKAHQNGVNPSRTDENSAHSGTKAPRVKKDAQKPKKTVVNGKVAKNKAAKKMNKPKNTIKFKMLFNKKKGGKKSKQL